MCVLAMSFVFGVVVFGGGAGGGARPTIHLIMKLGDTLFMNDFFVRDRGSKYQTFCGKIVECVKNKKNCTAHLNFNDSSRNGVFGKTIISIE